MFYFPPTIILRHRRENLKKCSLSGLETREDMRFYTYPKDSLPDVAGYVLLTMDAPVLTPADAGRGLLLIDGTWRYAAQMRRVVPEGIIERSLPSQYRTAYPRRQEDCPDPEKGLASIEALYVAYHILGRSTEGLLDCYFWKNGFLAQM
ncbi:MAG: hypothetical protein JSR58_06265 [Verrucomicrobia bacterium]|nr:hypothetical protein [Verrucomicrobiota bacterium]